MLNSKMKQLLLGGAAATLAMFGTAYATTNINLSVASNFYGTGTAGSSAITDIIAAFQTANPSYTVTVVANGATSDLEASIIAGNTAGADLFLAADTAAPADLATNHSSLVVGSPFNYAEGFLAFYTNTTGVDVTCDPSGSCGYNSTTYPVVGIADPATAPYGYAALQLLTGRYGIAYPSSYINASYSNITLVYNAVYATTQTVGFVALSAICSGGSYPTSGNTLVYPPTDTSVSPVIYNYDPLVQAAIEIAHTRSPDQNTELAAFVTFLQDHSTGSPMITTLTNYCYGTPSSSMLLSEAIKKMGKNPKKVKAPAPVH